MSYAVAAYLITVGTLAGYAWLLVRERARLHRDDGSEPEQRFGA